MSLYARMSANCRSTAPGDGVRLQAGLELWHSWTMTMLFKWAAFCAAFYLLIVLAAYLGQRRLMYFPDGKRTAPAEAGLQDVEEVVLETGDGARVIAWWQRARPEQPTLLYFHGNAGSLALRAETFRRYQAFGRGIFMMSYRGYSGSTGSPSEAANVADAVLAYQRLVDAGVDPSDIILYGESLGSGVAVQLAAQRPVAGVILDAPYTSIVDVGAKAYPFLPVRLLMMDRYDSLSRIAKIEAPLLVLHGARDRVVPVDMGRAMHAAAPGPKELAIIPLAGHNDHHLHGSMAVTNAWIDRLRATGARAAK